MPSTRKFYRTIIQVEVLSEEPYSLASGDAQNVLEQVGYDIIEGHCCGTIDVVESEEVDGLIMAKLLEAHHSDPEFFGLTPEGEDIEGTRLHEGDPCPECGVILVDVTEEDGTHLKCGGCGLYWDAEDEENGQ